MIGRWIATHRSLVATAASGVVIAAVVATLAIVSTGYTAQKLDLGDGAVWVANGQSQVIGRANPAVLELNSVVHSKGAQLSVTQAGDEVLLVDRADATVSVVDPATSTAGQPIALPPQQPQVAIVGDRIAIYEGGTGQLWIVDRDQLPTFDATGPATLNLGAHSVISTAPDGTLVAFSPSTGKVYRVDAATSDVVAGQWTTGMRGSSTYQTTSVGDQWAVLDTRTRILQLQGRTVDLSGLIPDASDPVLQQPGPAGDRVLVASDNGLVSVPLNGGAPIRLVANRTGAPAAPLVLGECVYAAWSSGQGWRRCGTAAAADLRLPGMTGSAALSFLVNTAQVVLNDARGGASWAVQHGGELIDNWDGLIKKDDQRQQQQNDQDVPPDVDPQQKPPVAVDDSFGARPGRSSVLPVLLNDYDPNGDVLVIDSFDQLDPAQGRIDLINSDQELQITLPSTASAPIDFSYTISDGRGGTASATVHVAIRTPDENSPPQQVRVTKTTVGQGGRVSTQVIGDWVDPDGDPFYLVDAVSTSGDLVTHTPQGVVTFADSGGGTTAKSVTLTMSDGRAQGSGSLSVTVKPPGQVPITIEDWAAPATAGVPLTLHPLDHVRGGDGTIRLNAVPAKSGATITPNFADGTFAFSSTQVGTHYVDFTVTDGTRVASGLVRVVVASPDANSKPITVPKTIFVSALSSQTIDPTATDIDPAGGVLVVTGLENVPPGAVEAEVLDQRDVRVTLTKPLEGATVGFNYRISNGLADTLGTISVVEIPEPTQLQPPVAVDDQVTVRVGDTIDIPVLDNDSQPDGKPITLQPKLAQPLPAGGGLLFASGSVLRYLAPRTAGNYSAVYSVAGPDGQTAQATVTISVREVNASTNNPPVPQRVVARALAGGDPIKVPIPLSGIDPDGDSVSLIGIASNPQKGSVLAVDPSDIVYQAGPYSSGTDTFQYTVVDALGARATGTIRIGISAPLAGARNPVANPDRVQARPGRTVSVQVLANDSDPDGSPLTVVDVRANTPGTKARIIGGRIVQLTPPKTPGTYAAIYTIENEYGGTSSNFVTVTVDPKAPLAYPVVNDTVLTVSDVIDRSSLDVAVLDNVFFADGPVSSLKVALLPGYGTGSQVLPNGDVRVRIGARSQIIPFSVTHPDDPGIRSYGFIHVPGTDDALPQLNTKAAPLTVKSEQTLTIDLDQYVVTLAGKGVRITDNATVKATHANGDDLVVNAHTLQYTSAARYFGPASITFEVTDGSSANGGAGRTAILTLPIKVTPRDNQPPDFVGNVVDFEPGQSKELDLVKLTNYPYPDVNELAYTINDPRPADFQVALNGQRLTISAHDDAKAGTTETVSIGVRDAVNSGQSGLITLQVVPSTRPLAQPVPDRAVTPRGGSTSVDVLANDEANNPFPDKPLRVVDIRGIDGASLPDGVSITPNADKSRLTVTVASSASPGDTALQYEVADATGDPSRYVWGSVTISVQDVPDPVTDVHVTEFGDRLLKVGWSPGVFNNSPITGYQVTLSDPTSGTVDSTTSCATTVGCALATLGNGPSNAVVISVVAINGIGPSTPTTMPGTIWSDIIPPPPDNPSVKPLDGGLRVSWDKPAFSGGSPITQYVITVGGVVSTLGVSPSDPVGTHYSRNVTGGSIRNGAVTAFSISARNSAPNSLATWNEADGTGIPAGAPVAVGSASASASTTDGTTANVSWAGAFSDNGAAITDYWALISTGSAPACTVTGVENGDGQVTPPTDNHFGAGTSTASFGGLSPNTTYTVYVYAWNHQGCTAVSSNQVTPRITPPVVTSAAAGALVVSGTGTWDAPLTSPVPPANGNTSYDYRILVGGAPGDVGTISPGGSALLQDSTAYGAPNVTFELRECDSWPEVRLCSTSWSQPFPMQEPVANTQLGSLQAVSGPLGGGTWSWGSIPTGSYTAMDYRCDTTSSWAPLTPNGSCTAGVIFRTAPLQVRITANGGQTYVRSYDAGDYAG